MKLINIFVLFCFLILLYMPLSSFGNISYREELFDGNLYLSNPPGVGQEAIITLDLTAVSGDCGATTIVFRMPDGIAILDSSIFAEPFYAKGMTNQYKTAIKVSKEGVYALQASVYSEISGGRQKAEHFYTYLTVTKDRSWVNDRTNYLTPSEEGIDVRITNLAPPEQALAMGTLSIQGHITYHDDNLARPVPIRNLKVLLFEVKQDNSLDLLGTTQTDDDGFYVFNGANVPELDDGSTRNLQTRIAFENEFIKIVNTNDKIYSFDMPLIQNASVGLLVSDYFLNEVNQQRSLGNIFNTALKAYVFLQQKLGWSRNKLPLIWPYDGDYSNYYYKYRTTSGILTYEAMRITIKSQWDRTTFYHEYGHSVMMALYGYNQKNIPKGEYQGVHSARTVSDPEFAMNEGWAEFFEALIEDNAFNFPQYSNRDTPNIEYNEWWKGKEEDNTDGEIVEGTIASILWDIVDTPKSIDEKPNIDDDGMSDMIVELWDLMAKDKPQKITDLWNHWQENGYGQVEELQSIFIDNGVDATINPINQPPTAIPMTVKTDEDNVVSIQLAGNDPESDTLTYTISEQPKKGNLTGDAPNLTYTPNDEYNGSDSFNFVANDGNANSQPATVSITVNPVNDVPIAESQAITTQEDSSVEITLTGSDVDGDELTFSIVDQPSYGTIEETPPSFTYKPDDDFNGMDSFSFIVNDGSLDSQPANVEITVTSVQDIPVAVPQSAITDEDTPIDIVLTGTSVDDDELTYKIIDSPVNGVLEGETPNITYKPNENFNGDDSFTFVVSIGVVESVPVMVSIKVNSINDAPSADAQSLIIDENTSANIELTGNDIDGDVPTFKIDIQPENGELSGEIPDLVYEPNYGFSGLDSFTFVADDGVAASEPVKIEITVNSMPNPFDVNKDGMVDILDIAFVSRYFGKADFPKDLNPDVNRDGEVDSQDLGIVMGNFGVKAE